MDGMDILKGICALIAIIFSIKFGQRKKSIYRILEYVNYKAGRAGRAQYYIQRKSVLFGFIPLWNSVMDSDGEYSNAILFSDSREAEKFIVNIKCQNNVVNGTVTNVIKEIKI